MLGKCHNISYKAQCHCRELKNKISRWKLGEFFRYEKSEIKDFYNNV